MDTVGEDKAAGAGTEVSPAGDDGAGAPGTETESPRLGRSGQLRRVVTTAVFLVALYFLQQYVLGLVFHSHLVRIARQVCGPKADFFVARLDVVLGRVVLNDLKTEDWLVSGKTDVGKLVIYARHGDIVAGRTKIRKVDLIRPVFFFDIGGEVEAAEVGVEETLPQPYLVEELSVERGMVLFRDPATDGFEFKIVKVDGKISNLTNTATRIEEPSKIQLEGELPGKERGQCVLWGTFNPGFPLVNFHLDLQLFDLPLDIFEPYGKEAYFEKGWLDYKLKAVCENYALSMGNEAVLRDIKIKERKFTLRKVFGLTADKISEHVNSKKGGFKLVFTVKDDTRREAADIFLGLMDRLAREGQGALKGEAGGTVKENIKGIFF